MLVSSLAAGDFATVCRIVKCGVVTDRPGVREVSDGRDASACSSLIVILGLVTVCHGDVFAAGDIGEEEGGTCVRAG